MISEIMDTIKAINDGLKDVEVGTIIKNRNTSISRRSKNAICYFPVLTSRSISYEEITMINKVLERNYTTFLRIAMSLDDVLDEKASKEEYIKRFHNNFDQRVGRNVLDSTEKYLGTAATVMMAEDSKPYSFTNLTPEENKILESKLADIKSVFKKKEVINYSPLQEDVLAPIGRTLVKHDSNLNEASNLEGQLLDNDVKKANEAVPTTLNIEIRIPGQKESTNILMGVKTITHPIESEEMIFNVANCIREKRFFFRTIQWTSGEIKFFKDFVLASDRIKANIAQSRNKTNWWRSLRSKTLLGRIRQLGGKPNVIPNTTLVLSMDEVEYISNSYGINLLNDVQSVTKLLDHFSLLGFVILDNSSELAYILYDGESSYQTYSYTALERENRNNANDMKALVSLLGR